MSTFIAVLFTTQSCPACKRPVLVQLSGTIGIGSPLAVCRGCGRVYHTALRREWYTFKHKALTLFAPFLLGCTVLLGGFIMPNSNFVFWAPVCFLVGLGVSIKNIIQMLLSKKRMGNPAYLSKLLSYGEIDSNQYQHFLSQCKK